MVVKMYAKNARININGVRQIRAEEAAAIRSHGVRVSKELH